MVLISSTETTKVPDSELTWLTFDHFLGLVAFRLYDPKSREELQKAFEQFDVSGDGELADSEIRQVDLV